MSLLTITNLTKRYGKEGERNSTLALNQMNFSVEEGEFLAIMGESGSGKSTLLNLIATFDRPTSGEITLQGQSLLEIKEDEIAAFRRNHLGFVFQNFNLLDQWSNRDNILLPLVLSGENIEEMEKKLKVVSQRLHLEELLEKFPYEVSGGQQQRIAIGRAVITSPSILLADEPTGALDSKTAQEMMEVFTDLNQKGQTILMVTHSYQAAAYAGRILMIQDGKVAREIKNEHTSPQAFFEKISQERMSFFKGEGQ